MRTIIHELPLIKVLLDPEGAELLALIQAVHDRYTSDGIEPAIDMSVQPLGAGAEVDAMRAAMDVAANSVKEKDIRYWFDHELTKYAAHEVNLQAFADSRSKIVVAAGSDSVDGPFHVIRQILAKAADTKLAMMPGGQVGFAIQPEPFAKRVLQIMA